MEFTITTQIFIDVEHVKCNVQCKLCWLNFEFKVFPFIHLVFSNEHKWGVIAVQVYTYVLSSNTRVMNKQAKQKILDIYEMKLATFSLTII